MKAIRNFFAILLLGALAACATQSDNEKMVEKSTLEQQARASLNELYGLNQTAKDLSSQAQGVLVFPSIVKASFVVGGQTGDGVLFVDNKPAGYYDVSGLSFGFQAGGQAYSQVLMFLTQEALDKFRSGAGFEVGVDGGVTVIDADMAKSINTSNLKNDIVAFIYSSSGLAGGVALDGTKYTKKSL